MFVKLCLLAIVILVESAWVSAQRQAVDTRLPNAANSQLNRSRIAHQLVDRAKNFEDLQNRTLTLVKLATLLWQEPGEERYARQIFVSLHDDLKLAAASQSQSPSTTNSPNLPRLQQLIARSLSRFDSKLATEWFEQDLNGDSRTQAVRRMSFAVDLASEGSSSGAVRFAQSAIDTAFPDLDLRMLLSLLHRLRAVDQPAADSLFVKVLSRVSAQPRMKADDLLLLGNYVFIKDADATPDNVRYTGVTIEGVYFAVGISGERAGLSRQIVTAYLQTGLAVLNYQLSDSTTQFPKRYEATARMLLEKAQKFAPELVPSLTALAREFSVSTIADTPFPTAQSRSELVNYDDIVPELEKLQGTSRDERALALIGTAYLQNDLETALRLTDWLTADKLRVKVRELILFRRGSNDLEKGDLPGAEKIASQLKISELIVLLHLGLAQLEIKNGQKASALSHLQLVQSELRDQEITGAGMYLLNTGSLIVKIDPNAALDVFDLAVKAFDGSPAGLAELLKRDHLSRNQAGKTSIFFSLDSKSIPFGNFEDCIGSLFIHSQGQILPVLLRLKNEKILGPALVAVAKELLVKKTSTSLRTQPVSLTKY